MKEFTAWLELAKPSERKVRLFACGCARSVWSLLTDLSSRQAVEVAERYVDGLATEEELSNSYRHAPVDFGANLSEPAGADIAWLAASWLHMTNDFSNSLPVWIKNTPQCPLAAILARIAGPCRVTCGECRGFGYFHVNGTDDNPDCQTCKGHGVIPQPLPTLCGYETVRGMYHVRGSDPDCTDCQHILRWNDGTVPRIAQHLYDDRDADALPILADALEEASCASPVILEHLRSDGGACQTCHGGGRCERDLAVPRSGRIVENCFDCHGSGRLPARFVRGDWVVDLLLGKS